MDTLSILSIILAVSSITLALVAIWFSWVSYKNSTDLQMKAQSILEQISQKVELIVDKTSHQIDRAWDYFTQKIEPINDKKEVITFNLDELKKEIVEETKNETIKIISEAGLDNEKIRQLERKVESVVNKITDRTQEVFNKQLILDKYTQIENELKMWLLNNYKWHFPPNVMLMQIINNKEISSVLPETLRFKLSEITDIRNKVAHSKEVSKDELENSIFTANDLISFFRIK